MLQVFSLSLSPGIEIIRTFLACIFHVFLLYFFNHVILFSFI